MSSSEVSTGVESFVAELNNGAISEYQIQPEDFGLQRQSIDSLIVENSAQSLVLVEQALAGKHDAASDIVALNAGAAIYVAGHCLDLAAGVDMARDAIGSGMALEKFKDFVDFSRQIGEVG